MSHVICHVSHVMSNVSCVKCRKKIYIYVHFSWQSVGAYRWRVCYQRGLPCLVFYGNNSNSTFIHTKKLHMKNLYIRISISTREILEAYTQSIAQSGMNLPIEQGKPLKICPMAQGICLSQRRRFSLTQQSSAGRFIIILQPIEYRDTPFPTKCWVQP